MTTPRDECPLEIGWDDPQLYMLARQILRRLGARTWHLDIRTDSTRDGVGDTVMRLSYYDPWTNQWHHTQHTLDQHKRVAVRDFDAWVRPQVENLYHSFAAHMRALDGNGVAR